MKDARIATTLTIDEVVQRLVPEAADGQPSVYLVDSKRPDRLIPLGTLADGLRIEWWAPRLRVVKP